jgi:hypothetical protein
MGRAIGPPLALIASVLLAPSHADGPSAPGYDLPRDYAAAVTMLRDDLSRIGRARDAGEFLAAQEAALRLSAVALATPSLARSPGALADTPHPDSARAAIDRACDRLDALAREILEAATGRDGARVSAGLARANPLLAELDARARKEYVCPMRCERRTYAAQGACPVCGMRLQLVTDDRYRVELTAVPAQVRARVPVTLQLRLVDPAGFEVGDLEVVHEKLLHLMIVSRNLSRFDHVHPTPLGPGRFSLRHTFPAGGTFRLFHDFTTTRAGMQIVPVELQVLGSPPDSLPLLLDAEWPKRVDGYDVTLTHTGLALGAECAMTFTLTRRGRPVTDLEPFLGAPGHLVLIRDDGGAYVHSHPLPENATTGPRVQFNMVFSRPGLYKAWGQFQRRGRVITVPFVIEVTPDGHPGGRAAAPGPGRRRGARGE